MNAPAVIAVVAVVATQRRAPELARLLESLARIPRGLHRVIVVDNAGDAATRDAAQSASCAVEYLPQARNLGCGGGLAVGERAALLDDRWTHLWILDDDAVVAPDCLEKLLAALAEGAADMAHPLTVDAAGRLGWPPGLLDAQKFRIVLHAEKPEDFLAQAGADPVPFSWSQGIALLVTRRALEALGVHRDDYWVRGEDLEFSLRITHRFRGLYVPGARVQHLPPPATAAAGDEEYRKHRAMLQNIAYTALRLPHGRRIAKTLPGNWLRFVRTWGFKPRVLRDVAISFFRGAVRGWPAGHA